MWDAHSARELSAAFGPSPHRPETSVAKDTGLPAAAGSTPDFEVEAMRYGARLLVVEGVW